MDDEEYGDLMHAGGSDEYEQHQHQMQQMKAKFKFKIGSSNNGSNHGGVSASHSHQFPITSSTSYGTKFIDLRKTFQNFNANSNKALQTATGGGVISVPGMMGGLSGA